MKKKTIAEVSEKTVVEETKPQKVAPLGQLATNDIILNALAAKIDEIIAVL